jgi:Zn-dependent peptidase ImmA (M78 family)
MPEIDPAEMVANARNYEDLDGEPWNGLFVRSQVQVTFDSPQATGHRMTPFEVADIFGKVALAKIVDDGGFPIVRSPYEPAQTLKRQRNTLGLTIKQVAKASGIDEAAVIAAETEGTLNPVRNLERLAQQLGLNEHRIGLGPEPGGAGELGTRLKRSMDQKDKSSMALTPETVLRLAEAAWVIARQAELEERLSPTEASRERPRTEPLFPGPAWKQGYELAGRTRELFRLDYEDPIVSLRSLLDEQNGIPLLALEMGKKVAGATLANGRHRGIVVNTVGLNENVWVRRTTAAHELCHFLWDSDENLDRLRVDSYDVLEGGFRRPPSDPIEQRANAFAVEFLAPRRGILGLIKSAATRTEAVSLISQHYGISVSAATYHLDNANHGNTALYGEAHLSVQPSDEWRAAENFGLDFFPMKSSPYSRRGRFAQLVARAVDAGRLTSDSGALLLAAPLEEFRQGMAGLLQLDLHHQPEQAQDDNQDSEIESRPKR